MDGASQMLFNIVVAIAGAVSVFILYAVWSKLNELEKSDTELTKEISKIHVLVAGEYVKKTEIAPQLTEIFQELKGIRHDLSTKAERRPE